MIDNQSWIRVSPLTATTLTGLRVDKIALYDVLPNNEELSCIYAALKSTSNPTNNLIRII